MREGFRLVGLEFLLGVWRKDVGQRVGAFGIQQPRRLKGSGGALFVQGGGGFAGNRWEGRSRLHHRGGGRFRCRLLGHGLERGVGDAGAGSAPPVPGIRKSSSAAKSGMHTRRRECLNGKKECIGDVGFG